MMRWVAEVVRVTPHSICGVTMRSVMKENGTGVCFLAVPREIQRDGAIVTGFAPQADDLASFERQFISATEAGLTLDRQMISPDQCAALELVGAMSPKDGGGLALQLVEAEVGDGATLLARVGPASQGNLGRAGVDHPCPQTRDNPLVA